MKFLRSLRIGQLVGTGLNLILLLALLIALGLISAYVISKQQSEVVQNRAMVESLTQELEILSTQRSDFMRRYLESGDEKYIVNFQSHEIAFEANVHKIGTLLSTPEEQQSLQSLATAENALDDKAQETLRLYKGFPGAARLLWASEGNNAHDKLVLALEELRQVQGDASAQLVSQARRIEQWALTGAIVFVVLALIGGLGASLIITRIIAQPITELVQTVTTLGSDLTVRSQVKGPREIAFLGDAVNDMAAHLLTSRQALQQHNERLATELTLASQMQASFLPASLPPLPGWELAVSWQSAREMGGDFYTYINLGQGQRGLALGDVNGKGASAAMAGALTVGLLEAYAPSHGRPESLLAQLNDDLYVRFRSNRMNVACCYLIMHDNSLQLSVANAGCVFPYLRRGDNVIEVQVGGMPLGAWPHFNYVPESLAIYPGDLLVLSSDGLVEAKNQRDELYGFDRLAAELRNLPATVDAQTALNQLLRSVRGFIGNTELHDDMTILVARFVGRNGH
jgi:serine phosphatase RsbU (regulator of sigma subunit)/CHASE3 domain sensor protein